MLNSGKIRVVMPIFERISKTKNDWTIEAKSLHTSHKGEIFNFGAISTLKNDCLIELTGLYNFVSHSKE